MGRTQGVAPSDLHALADGDLDALGETEAVVVRYAEAMTAVPVDVDGRPLWRAARAPVPRADRRAHRRGRLGKLPRALQPRPGHGVRGILGGGAVPPPAPTRPGHGEHPDAVRVEGYDCPDSDPNPLEVGAVGRARGVGDGPGVRAGAEDGLVGRGVADVGVGRLAAGVEQLAGVAAAVDDGVDRDALVGDRVFDHVEQRDAVRFRARVLEVRRQRRLDGGLGVAVDIDALGRADDDAALALDRSVEVDAPDEVVLAAPAEAVPVEALLVVTRVVQLDPLVAVVADAGGVIEDLGDLQAATLGRRRLGHQVRYEAVDLLAGVGVQANATGRLELVEGQHRWRLHDRELARLASLARHDLEHVGHELRLVTRLAGLCEVADVVAMVVAVVRGEGEQQLPLRGVLRGLGCLQIGDEALANLLGEAFDDVARAAAAAAVASEAVADVVETAALVAAEVTRVVRGQVLDAGAVPLLLAAELVDVADAALDLLDATAGAVLVAAVADLGLVGLGVGLGLGLGILGELVDVGREGLEVAALLRKNRTREVDGEDVTHELFVDDAQRLQAEHIVNVWIIAIFVTYYKAWQSELT